MLPVRALGFSLLCAIVLCQSGAIADVSDPAAARAQLLQGFELKQQGKCEEAIPHFVESQRLERNPKTLLNLMDCEERTTRLAAAQRHAVEAKDLAQQRGLDQLGNLAEEHLKAIEKRMPRLTLKLAKDAELGTTIARDGVELGAVSLGTALPIDPGTHTILARDRNAQRRYTIILSEGQAAELEVSAHGGEPIALSVQTSVPPASHSVSPPQIPTATLSGGSSSARTWTLIGEGAVAAAGLAVGVGYLIVGNAADQKLDDAKSRIDLIGGSCAAPTPNIQRDCATLASSNEDPDHDRTLATGGFVAAGVGAVALVTTWLLWKTDGGSAVSVSPIAARHSRGFALAWTF
jgi:hypothetical protein